MTTRGFSSLWGFISADQATLRSRIGPAGADGPTGPTGSDGGVGGLVNDSEGKAAVQTRADSENVLDLEIPYGVYLSLLNDLEVKLWAGSEEATSFATPITQASILGLITGFGEDGATDLGAFEVPSVSTGAGATIEVESMFGTLVGAIKGLGFRPSDMSDTSLVSTGMGLAYEADDGDTYGAISANTFTLGRMSEGVNVSLGTTAGESGRAPFIVMNDQDYGLPMFSVAAAGNFTGTHEFAFGRTDSCHVSFITDSELGISNPSSMNVSAVGGGLNALSLTRLRFAPSLGVTDSANASAQGSYTTLVIDDVDAPASVVLPTTNTPTGTLLYIKKRTASTANDITVSVEGGATIDGATSVLLSEPWDFLQVCFDGTNYLIIAQQHSTVVPLELM